MTSQAIVYQIKNMCFHYFIALFYQRQFINECGRKNCVLHKNIDLKIALSVKFF